MADADSMDEILHGLANGNRRSLALALSLVESTAPADLDRAAELLTRLSAVPRPASRRLCLTGAPGVGKSTLLEAFGMALIERGHRVAVLAIDPSSQKTGGSILGDKVRMQRLGVHDQAFVRPSPSRSALGGAAAATRDAILVCEAAGFDTVIVETVGVGQSEIEAADLVDLFVLLVLPTAGDDVQGIKRGIMEVADAIVVTKADLDADQASRATAMYRSILGLMLPSKPEWQTPVAAVSAVTAAGLQDLMDVVTAFFSEDRRSAIEHVRRHQRLQGFDLLLRRRLTDMVSSDVRLHARFNELRHRVAQDHLAPTAAVHSLLQHCTIDLTETL